jgi:hypothetical protein
MFINPVDEIMTCTPEETLRGRDMGISSGGRRWDCCCEEEPDAMMVVECESGG